MKKKKLAGAGHCYQPTDYIELWQTKWRILAAQLYNMRQVKDNITK